MSDNINADTAAINERHRVRMERKKAIIDAAIAKADKEIGIIIVNTGNGKGKSSSGFGMAIRAMGHGMKVGVVQFIKGAMSTGEEKFLRRFPDEISFHAMGEGYTWETQNRERDIEKAELVHLAGYMPAGLSDEEVAAEVAAAVAASGAAGPQDMGKVMAIVKPKLAGRADMTVVSALVKKALTPAA